jgi:hypothetical protein
MTNQEAYQYLIDINVQWSRKDKNTIYVCTSGYKTHGPNSHYGIEEVLMKAGMRMISEEFDSLCGKTTAYYKHN